MKSYLFTSQRLGFRNWEGDDLLPYSKMCADPEVMKYFPGTLNEDECQAFINNMNAMFEDRGHCYFAVDTLDNSEFIGFIGLKWQTDRALDHPYLDIGWRLKKAAWGKGYGTEGAKECLKWAFDNLGQKSIYATATKENAASIRIMQKLGMQFVKEYSEPIFAKHPIFDKAVIYAITK